MGKILKVFTLVIMISIIVSMFMCSCSNNNNNVNSNTKAISTPTAIETNKDWQGQFVSDLEKNNFLPEQILQALPDYKVKKEDDGTTLYMWSDWDKEKKDYIHNIQMVSDGDQLLNYHYKNYYFEEQILEESITKEDASKMVRNFARTFLYNSDQLSFKNDSDNQIQSLYDPSHVETWTASTSNGNHSIVVNFDIGGIVYYLYSK